jgi:hypothetical protein
MLDERVPTAGAMYGAHELNEPARQIIPLFFDVVCFVALMHA